MRISGLTVALLLAPACFGQTTLQPEDIIRVLPGRWAMQVQDK